MIGNKFHFVVVGATGVVGQVLLNMLLEHDRVGKVTVLTRREITLTSDKLQVRVVDFDTLHEREVPGNADAVFCCLGTTMRQAGSKDAFRRVDYEYVVKLAVFAQRQGVPQYHVISAAGANADSKVFYNKVKGRMELEVKKLDKIRSIYFYRPSMLLGNREEFRPAELFGKYLMRIFQFAIPSKFRAIHPAEVALAMVSRALQPKKGTFVVANDEMISEGRG